MFLVKISEKVEIPFGITESSVISLLVKRRSIADESVPSEIDSSALSRGFLPPGSKRSSGVSNGDIPIPGTRKPLYC